MRDNHSDKALFTVILEYSGTTSAAQVRASDQVEAIQVWLNALRKDESYGLTKEQGTRLLRAFDIEEVPVAIQGLNNVWCKTVLAEDQLALLHVIKTIEHRSNTIPDRFDNRESIFSS